MKSEIHLEECHAAQIDPGHVRSIARRIERALSEANAMGLYAFGGAFGGLSLRVVASDLSGTGSGCGDIIVANIYGCTVSGGDGGQSKGSDGLERGER